MIDTETLARATLADIPGLVWGALEAGARRAAAPLHTGAVATLAEDGPRVRTVVLRRVDTTERRLVFHTDRRSPKFAELERDPRIAWHFYAAELKLQIRLQGRASLHTGDAFADAQWDRSRPSSRLCYRTPAAPGTPLAGAVDISDSTAAPGSAAGAADGRDQFAVVACRVQTFDWLFLRHQGHRRAHFVAEGAAWHGLWVAP